MGSGAGEDEGKCRGSQGAVQVEATGSARSGSSLHLTSWSNAEGGERKARAQAGRGSSREGGEDLAREKYVVEDGDDDDDAGGLGTDREKGTGFANKRPFMQNAADSAAKKRRHNMNQCLKHLGDIVSCSNKVPTGPCPVGATSAPCEASGSQSTFQPGCSTSKLQGASSITGMFPLSLRTLLLSCDLAVLLCVALCRGTRLPCRKRCSTAPDAGHHQNEHPYLSAPFKYKSGPCFEAGQARAMGYSPHSCGVAPFYSFENLFTVGKLLVPAVVPHGGTSSSSSSEGPY